MPAICQALDEVLVAHGLTSRDVARLLGVDESTVSRWRARTEPGRDAVRTIEEHLGLRVGHISALAGYAEMPGPDAFMEWLAQYPGLTDAERRVALRVLGGIFEDAAARKAPPKKKGARSETVYVTEDQLMQAIRIERDLNALDDMPDATHGQRP